MCFLLSQRCGKLHAFVQMCLPLIVIFCLLHFQTPTPTAFAINTTKHHLACFSHSMTICSAPCHTLKILLSEIYP
jgi:hypothetical protein